MAGSEPTHSIAILAGATYVTRFGAFHLEVTSIRWGRVNYTCLETGQKGKVDLPEFEERVSRQLRDGE